MNGEKTKVNGRKKEGRGEPEQKRKNDRKMEWRKEEGKKKINGRIQERMTWKTVERKESRKAKVQK